MKVAGLEAGELGDVVGLLVLDVVTGLLQHLAHDVGGDVLAGPVMDGQNDRILGFHFRRGRRHDAQAGCDRAGGDRGCQP